MAQASLPPAAPAPSRAAPSFSSGGEDYRFADFIDQVMPGTFKLQPPEAIAGYRKAHHTLTGGDPPDAARPTSEQLCALHFRLAAGRSPYTDFAVWTPWNARVQKQNRFTAQAFVQGVLQSQ